MLMIVTPVTWTRIAGDRQVEIGGGGGRGSTKVAVGGSIGRRVGAGVVEHRCRTVVAAAADAAVLYVKVGQLEGWAATAAAAAATSEQSLNT